MHAKLDGDEETSPLLSSLRLLTSPLRLLCATIWQIIKEKDVLNFGLLEEFVRLITEAVPELMNHRQRAQLILGLRAKVVLELCRSESSTSTDVLNHHLEKIQMSAASLQSTVRDADVEASQSNFLALVDILQKEPAEKDIFFQEVFPVNYGPRYDLALEELVWGLISRLEKILPMPTLDKVASLLGVSTSITEECLQALSHPQDFLNTLQHFKDVSLINDKASSLVQNAAAEDCIFSSLSCTYLPQAMKNMENKVSETETKSSFSGERLVDSEVLNVTASNLNTAIEASAKPEEPSKAGLDCGTKTKESLIDSLCATQIPATETMESIVSNKSSLIQEVDKVSDANSLQVMVEMEKTEVAARPLLTSEIICESTVDCSYAPSMCGTAVDHPQSKDGLQPQAIPAIKCEEMKRSGKLMSSAPQRQSSRVCKKRVQLLWKKNKGPQIIWIGSEDQAGLTQRKGDEATMPKAAKMGLDQTDMVFSCSKCSFYGTSETCLHQHLMKKHPDEFSRLLSAGVGQSSLLSQCADQAEYEMHPSRKSPVLRSCLESAKTVLQDSDMKRQVSSHTAESESPCKKEQNCSNETSEDFRNGAEACKASPAVANQQPDGEAPDPRRCPICRLSLAQASDMERHMRSHSMEKPYECSHCPRAYRYPYNLKKHRDTHHKMLAQSEGESVESPGDGSQKDPFRKEIVEAADSLESLNSKVCPVCVKAFTRAACMRRHLRGHTRQQLGVAGTSPQKLLQNQDTGSQASRQQGGAVSAKQPLVCGTCGKRFSFLTHFRQHMRGHRLANKPPKRFHKCAKCEEKFRTLYDLGKHQRCHWGDDPLRCTQCGRRFSTSSQLGSHKQIHSFAFTMKCTMCEEVCSDYASLRLHYMQAHNTKGSYPCLKCEKTFPEVGPLVRHMRTHTGERPYCCTHCSKTFSSYSKLCLHKRSHCAVEKTPRERRHLCHQCGKCFYTSAELTRHEVVHREERPHTCTLCNKAFKRLRSLTSHMESHMESQARLRYPCTYCDKRFMKAGALVRHHRIHTGERPHCCRECGKSFLTHSEVLKHMRYHTGERPFKCDVCSKSFTQSCYLTGHMRTHTGERPYACSLCDKRFSDSAHRKRHMLTHTKEKPHVCEKCGRAFNRKNLLNVHLRTCA